jgi:protein MpaA
MVDATPPAYVHRQVMLGRSQQGRPIFAWEIGDPKATRRTLVVGAIHGDEPAGIAIARALVHTRPPARTVLWIVPDLNPDGVAAGTRQNARGVDLNRNFSYRWRPLGPPGTTFYAGPKALSERETRIAVKLVRRVRPTTSIWFHQHLNVVDASGPLPGVARRLARLVAMRAARLGAEPGSAVTWETRTFPGTAAFVVELPAGPVPPGRIARFTRAIRNLDS